MNLTIRLCKGHYSCAKSEKEKIYFLRVAPLQLTTHNTTLTLLNAKCFNTRKTAVFEETGSLF